MVTAGSNSCSPKPPVTSALTSRLGSAATSSIWQSQGMPWRPHSAVNTSRHTQSPSWRPRTAGIIRDATGCGRCVDKKEGFGAFLLPPRPPDTRPLPMTARMEARNDTEKISMVPAPMTARQSMKPSPETDRRKGNNSPSRRASAESGCNVCQFVRFELDAFEHRVSERLLLSLPQGSLVLDGGKDGSQREFYHRPITTRTSLDTQESAPIINILFGLSQLRTSREYLSLRGHFTLVELKTAFLRHCDEKRLVLSPTTYYYFISSLLESCNGYPVTKRLSLKMFGWYLYVRPGLFTVSEVNYGTFFALWEIWYGVEPLVAAQMHFSKCYQDMVEQSWNGRASLYEVRAIIDEYDVIVGGPTDMSRQVRQDVVTW